MTGDNFLKFRKFEKQIRSGFHSNYARFTSPELKEFSEIVSEWRGAPLTNQEKTCPRCLLKVLKTVGEEYQRYQNSPRGKAILKQEENGGEQTEEENNGSVA